MTLHESDQRLLKALNVVCLNVREFSLLAKWPNNSGSRWVTAGKSPHAHNLMSVYERVGNGFGLWLLYSFGKSLSKCIHVDRNGC